MNSILKKITKALGWAFLLVFIFFIVDDFILFTQELSLDFYNMIIEFKDYNPHPNEIYILQFMYGLMTLYYLIGIGSNFIRTYPSPNAHPLNSKILYG